MSSPFVTFGHCLRKSLPEDDFDLQPLASGPYLIAADVRLDNRDELTAALGLAFSVGRQTSDAAILLAAWERWGEASLDRLLGDYAFALWNSDAMVLSLVRAPMAMKSVYYHVADGFVAFASTPRALQALPQVGKSIDLEFASAVAAGIYPTDGTTIYEGISQLRPGCAVRFRDGAQRSWRFWRIRQDFLRLRDRREYGVGLRAELDRAVAAQSRGRGLLGAQLSSGRDSSAVATSAALLMKPDELWALTGAPRAGYHEISIDRAIVDESALAAQVAANFDNIRHVVCRRGEHRLFALLGEAHQLQQEPLPNPTNLPWWWSVHSHASRLGVSVLLCGGAGNFTISALGERHIVDLIRERKFGSWWRAARGFARHGYVGWPFLLRSSFAPWLPRAFDALLMRSSGRGHVFQANASLLAEPYRSAVEARFAIRMSDSRPAKSQYDFRRRMLYDWVFNDRFSHQRFGVELRDPTSDRRLIDYCLSLPVEALTAPGSSRPVYDAAFGDRVPQSILALKARGYQGADWHELTSAPELLRLIDHYWQSPAVAELLDRSAVRALAERWPDTAGLSENAASPFRDRLMAAMGMANFIAVTFDGLPAFPDGWS